MKLNINDTFKWRDNVSPFNKFTIIDLTDSIIDVRYSNGYKTNFLYGELMYHIESNDLIKVINFEDELEVL